MSSGGAQGSARRRILVAGVVAGVVALGAASGAVSSARAAQAAGPADPPPQAGPSTQAASASTCGAPDCPLDDVFTGAAHFAEDSSFSVDTPGVFWVNGRPTHVDQDTVDLGAAATGPRYRLFYRTFINPDGSENTNGLPAGIALATSSDGNNWSVYSSGKPVLANRPSVLQSGSACSPGPTCVVAVYAPSVVVMPNGSLAMVYETMDTGQNEPGPYPRDWIEGATSTDGGYTWQTLTDATKEPAKVLVAQTAWEGYNITSGVYQGNVGTPDLDYDPSSASFHVSYHGYSGSALARGFASGPSLLSLTRDPSNPDMTAGSGWSSLGPGKADDVQEGAYWYRVFEAFEGTAQCLRPDTEVGWGLARSTDRVHWSYSPLDPLRTDRINSSCGEDMPSWQIVAGQDPMVVVTNFGYPLTSQPTLKRYRIVHTPTTTTTAGVVALAQADSQAYNAGYWELDANGGVYGYGVTTYGHPSLSGTAVGLAGGPGDGGYWVLDKAGHVYAFGSAANLGDLSSPRLKKASAAAIEPDGGYGGYWIVTTAGEVHRFGDAVSLSGPASRPAQPVVSAVRTLDSQGLWLVTSGGTVYALGDAPYYGSLSAYGVSSTSIVGLIRRSDGNGYWLADSAGHLWAFGTSTAGYGSPNGYQPSSHYRITSVGHYGVGTGTSTVTGGVNDQTGGYLMAATDGGVVDFGAALFEGDVAAAGWNG